MIIQDLKRCGAETQRKIRELDGSNSAELDFLRRKMTALREFQSYVFSGNWTRKASREKYIALVRSKFDYKLIAERFNTTRESLNVFAARQDKRLERVMGEALRLIEQNKIEEGLERFYSLSEVFSATEFDYKPLELLPETPRKDSFLVSECGEEIAVLRSLMKSSVRERLNSADSGKLSYLIFLLNGDEDAFTKQREELVRELRRKDGAADIPLTR